MSAPDLISPQVHTHARGVRPGPARTACARRQENADHGTTNLTRCIHDPPPVQALPESPLIMETSIAGPGFINARLAPEWLAAELEGLIFTGAGAWAPPVPGGRQR
eukprot:3506152-Pyramimonas_sp.AAC.1